MTHLNEVNLGVDRLNSILFSIETEKKIKSKNDTLNQSKSQELQQPQYNPNVVNGIPQLSYSSTATTTTNLNTSTIATILSSQYNNTNNESNIKHFPYSPTAFQMSTAPKVQNEIKHLPINTFQTTPEYLQQEYNPQFVSTTTAFTNSQHLLSSLQTPYIPALPRKNGQTIETYQNVTYGVTQPPIQRQFQQRERVQKQNRGNHRQQYYQKSYYENETNSQQQKNKNLICNDDVDDENISLLNNEEKLKRIAFFSKKIEILSIKIANLTKSLQTNNAQ